LKEHDPTTSFKRAHCIETALLFSKEILLLYHSMIEMKRQKKEVVG